MKKHMGVSLLVLFPVLFIMVPLLVYAVLRMGWPPVVGNLTAAGAMRSYAAEAHPEWEAKGAWAGYNLVNGDYGLDFTYGELHYDRKNGIWLVRDERRENALRSELGITWRLKEGGELSDYVRWNAGWRPGDAETPYISLRVDCSSEQGDPVPTEEAMRAIMADHALEVYNRVAPAAAVDRFSVYYTHHAANAENGRTGWHSITVDLPEGAALTREMVLSGKLESR